MADLDAELLALAGGDDSSDEETPQNSSNNKQTSPPPSSGKGEDVGGEGTARKRRGKQRSRSKKVRDEDDDDDEDGEVSSASSAPMSESESDTSPPPDDQGPIFAYDKLFHSAKDKAEVMAMPEIQREELLSERAQQVDRHNQDIALRRLLASREKEENRAAEKKRKVGATDLDDNQRKSSRQKMTLGGRKVGEASGAIEAYKRQREQKGKRDEQRRRDASSRRKHAGSRSPSADASDADAHGESEVEWDEGRRHSPSPVKDEPPAELRDFQRCCVGRSNFAQVCFYPGFEAAIQNCYVRVAIGENKEIGGPEYRLCMIKRFTEGKPYALEAPNGRNFVTTQYALLAHGKAEREFPFIACSNSPITEAEFNRYRKTMAVEDCKFPTKSALTAKVADINNLLNHQFTKEELEEKLRRQGTNDNKQVIFQRIQLEKRRQEAIAAGDEAAIAQCDAERQALSGPKLAFGTSLVKPKTESSERDIAELNRRNQKLNAENVRRAELEERRARRKAAEAAARGEGTIDRFARVKTVARTHYDVNEKGLVPRDTSRSVTPGTGASTPNPKKSETLKPASAVKVKVEEKKTANGLPMIRHAPSAEDYMAAVAAECDIDIDIL